MGQQILSLLSKGESDREGILFHSFYLPLAAVVNHSLKGMMKKRMKVENSKFKCISFADDLT